MRQKQKREPENLATSAQSVLGVIPETTERTHDDANYSRSVRATKAKKRSRQVSDRCAKCPWCYTRNETERTHDDANSTQSVRAAEAEKRPRQVSDGAQSVPAAIPETKLEPTNDVAKCTKSVRALKSNHDKFATRAQSVRETILITTRLIRSLCIRLKLKK